jgi:hypothetical protein
MKPSDTTIIPSSESVARLLLSDWVVEGELQHTAFMLKSDETYISVNRPAIDTFQHDIASFLFTHPNYCVADTDDTYQCAILNVGDVRSINVVHEDKIMDVNVEIEPRNVHTKSHAGIFTRFHSENIKNGKVLKYGPIGKEISADQILLDVRFKLLSIATVEQHKVKK